MSHAYSDDSRAAILKNMPCDSSNVATSSKDDRVSFTVWAFKPLHLERGDSMQCIFKAIVDARDSSSDCPIYLRVNRHPVSSLSLRSAKIRAGDLLRNVFAVRRWFIKFSDVSLNQVPARIICRAVARRADRQTDRQTVINFS